MTVPSVELSKPKIAGAKQSLVPWRKTHSKEADDKQKLGKYQRQLQANNQTLYRSIKGRRVCVCVVNVFIFVIKCKIHDCCRMIKYNFVAFAERSVLNQQIGTEPPQGSSSTPSPGASASFRSPVEGTPSPGTQTTLSSLWFPMDEDFFAQTAEEKTLYGKQKIPSPVREKECIRTRRSSSHKIPNQENIGTQTVEVKPSSNESQRAKLRTPGVLSVRGQPDPKPTTRCARPLYPPTLRKSTSEIPKQVKKKSAKKPDKDFVCQDSECPYHRKPSQELAVGSQLEPTETTSGSRGQVPDMSAAMQKLPKIKTPYRPKGGYLYDPELDTKKTRGSPKPVLHRPSSAESIFLIVKPPSLGSCDNAQAAAAAAASTNAEIVPEVTPQFASFIRHRCMYLQDRNPRCLTPTMCSIKIPQGPIESLQSVQKMQSHLTQCNQLHEIRWI